MTTQPKDLRAELASVLALLDKATPGELMISDGPDGYQHRVYCENGLGLEIVADVVSRDDAKAIKAAVNFLRKHGAALTSHGGGGEAVAWRYRDNVRPGLPWHVTDDRNMIEAAQVGGGYEIVPLGPITTPQPRGEGMAKNAARYLWLRDEANFAAGLAPQVCMVDCLRGEYTMLHGEAVDANVDAAMLAAAPGEGSGECPCGESTCKEPWEPGCGLGTSMEHARPASMYGLVNTPPASQSAEPHCAVHGRFDIDCLDCSDALERQRKAASQSAPSEVNSRSRLRRIAAEKGEPAPRFDGDTTPEQQ